MRFSPAEFPQAQTIKGLSYRFIGGFNGRLIIGSGGDSENIVLFLEENV